MDMNNTLVVSTAALFPSKISMITSDRDMISHHSSLPAFTNSLPNDCRCKPSTRLAIFRNPSAVMLLEAIGSTPGARGRIFEFVVVNLAVDRAGEAKLLQMHPSLDLCGPLALDERGEGLLPPLMGQHRPRAGSGVVRAVHRLPHETLAGSECVSLPFEARLLGVPLEVVVDLLPHDFLLSCRVGRELEER